MNTAVFGGALARQLSGPQRLSRLLISLGPTFIKIGQLLALRPDILPPEYCDELLRLTDRVPPSPWEDIEAILAEELGADPEKRFATFSRRSFAAGSLAQVHLARTHEGVKVAVKIQRPDLEARIEKDIGRLNRLARLIKLSGISPLISPRDLSDELAAWLRQELDFTRELQNTLRMHELLAGYAYARAPRCFPELSGRKVLTTEFLEGVPVSELIRLADQGEPQAIERMGFDADLLAERLIELSMHQIFDLRNFHADPHPGNLIALPGNLIGMVDFGLTDVLDPIVESEQAAYLRAIYQSDVNQMYRSISRIFTPGANTDMEAFRREFLTETSRWVARMQGQVQPPEARSPVSEYMIALMRLARVHEMRLPVSGLSMYRSLLAAESVANHLGSAANLRSVGARFFTELQIRRLIQGWEPERVRAWLLEAHELVRAGPGLLQQFFTDLADGRFSMSVRTVTPSAEKRQANRRARLVTLSVLSVSVSLLLLLARQSPGAVGRGTELVLWACLAGIFVWIALIWRRLD